MLLNNGSVREFTPPENTYKDRRIVGYVDFSVVLVASKRESLGLCNTGLDCV
jgi:hypothetical protein